MAHCAARDCACPLPSNARFCPRCGRKVRANNASWLFMAFGVLLLLVIGLMMIRFDSRSRGYPTIESEHGAASHDAHEPVLPRPNGNFWRP